MSKRVFLIDACVMYDAFGRHGKNNLNGIKSLISNENIRIILIGKKLKNEYEKDVAMYDLLINLTLDKETHPWVISNDEEDSSFEKELEQFKNNPYWRPDGINKDNHDPHIILLCEIYNIDYLITNDANLLKEIIWNYLNYFKRRPPLVLTSEKWAAKYKCYEDRGFENNVHYPFVITKTLEKQN